MRILIYSLALLLLTTSCNNTKEKTTTDDETTEDVKPQKRHKPVVDDEETSTDETDAGWTDSQKTKAAKILKKALDPEYGNNNNPNSEEAMNNVYNCLVDKTEAIMTYPDFQAFVKIANSGALKEDDAPASMKQKGKQLEDFFSECRKKYHLKDN